MGGCVHGYAALSKLLHISEYRSCSGAAAMALPGAIAVMRGGNRGLHAARVQRLTRSSLRRRRRCW